MFANGLPNNALHLTATNMPKCRARAYGAAAQTPRAFLASLGRRATEQGAAGERGAVGPTQLHASESRLDHDKSTASIFAANE